MIGMVFPQNYTFREKLHKNRSFQRIFLILKRQKDSSCCHPPMGSKIMRVTKEDAYVLWLIKASVCSYRERCTLEGVEGWISRKLMIVELGY